MMISSSQRGIWMSRWKKCLVIAAAMACPIVAAATPLAPTAAAAEQCYAWPAYPNGAGASCSDGGRRWLKSNVHCQGVRGVYVRYGPRVFGGTGQQSLIYCNNSSDARLSYGWEPA